MTRSMEQGLSRFERLGEAAKRSKTLAFNNLLHHIDVTLLREAFYKLNLQAAKGVDEQSWKDYQEGLDHRLESLHQTIQSGRYKALPVKRLWLPKPNGDIPKVIGVAGRRQSSESHEHRRTM